MATPGPRSGDAHRLSEVAASLAAPARAEIACLLLSGTAHTGRELARHVGIAPSTASEHLSHLLDAGLLAVEVQGRHRYYRLADPQVAELLERMLNALPEPPTASTLPGPRLPAGMAFARSCYDHLAGRLGVAVTDALDRTGRLSRAGGFALTPAGLRWLDDLTEAARPVAAARPDHVAARRASRRPPARGCLDWTERREHLAGAAGAAICAHLLDQGWITRIGTGRAVRVTPAGGPALTGLFGPDPAWAP
jgi:DNA-binding transcriptional ArsR family regulator